MKVFQTLASQTLIMYNSSQDSMVHPAAVCLQWLSLNDSPRLPSNADHEQFVLASSVFILIALLKLRPEGVSNSPPLWNKP